MWESTTGAMRMSSEEAVGSQGREISQVSLSLLAEPFPGSSCCSLGEGARCSWELCAQTEAAVHHLCQLGMEREGIHQELELPARMEDSRCLVGGCEEERAGLGVQSCLSQLGLNSCLCCLCFPAAETQEGKTARAWAVLLWNGPSQGPLELAVVALRL